MYLENPTGVRCEAAAAAVVSAPIDRPSWSLSCARPSSLPSNIAQNLMLSSHPLPAHTRRLARSLLPLPQRRSYCLGFYCASYCASENGPRRTRSKFARPLLPLAACFPPCICLPFIFFHVLSFFMTLDTFPFPLFIHLMIMLPLPHRSIVFFSAKLQHIFIEKLKYSALFHATRIPRIPKIVFLLHYKFTYPTYAHYYICYETK